MSYVGNTNTTQAFTAAVDYFSGNGSTVAFTLSRPVASTAQVQVVVNNVPQNPTDAFTVLNNTITFTGAPSSGTNNIYVQYTSPITQVIQPGQGTVTSNSFGLITDFTTTGNTVLGNASTDTLNVGNGGLVKDASGNVGIGTSSPSYRLDVGTGSVDGNIHTYGSITSGTLAGYSIRSIPRLTNDTGTFENTYIGCGASVGNIIFQQGNSFTAASNTERARIDSSGKFILKSFGTPTDTDFALQVFADGTVGGVAVQTNQTGSRTAIRFRNPNGIVGQIETNGSNTSYGTSSDYRLKEDIQPMTGALTKVAALKPCTYKWKADGSDGQGFIAHELAEVCPGAVTGEKDAVNEDGSIKPQSIDTSFLVATLTAAIQEQQAIIADLTARVAALENK